MNTHTCFTVFKTCISHIIQIYILCYTENHIQALVDPANNSTFQTYKVFIFLIALLDNTTSWAAFWNALQKENEKSLTKTKYISKCPGITCRNGKHYVSIYRTMSQDIRHAGYSVNEFFQYLEGNFKLVIYN